MFWCDCAFRGSSASARFENGDPVGRPARFGQGDPERVQRLEVLALTVRLEDLRRLGRAAHLCQQQRSLPIEAFARQALLDRLLIDAARCLEVARVREEKGELQIAGLHLRVLGHDLPRDRDRLDRAFVLEELDDLVKLAIHLDQVLRIVLGTVRRLRLRGPRQIPEAPELLGFFRPDRPAVHRAGGDFEEARCAACGRRPGAPRRGSASHPDPKGAHRAPGWADR
jgi:hypothetical protein